MDDKMRLAIVAARAGQKKEAQFLLTQVLQDNPQEVNAWFLLSHLVDSEEKRIAYLEKVVALDPDHEKATGQLAELTAVSSPPAPAEPEIMLTDDSEREPAASVEDAVPDDPDKAMGWLEELAVTAAVEENADAPELAETIIAEASEPTIKSEPEAAETAVTTATVVPPARPEAATDDTSKQLQRLNITLAVLIILMIIVLYFLSTVLF